MEMKNASPLDSKAVLKKIDKSIVRISGKQNSKPKANKLKTKTEESRSRKTAEPKAAEPAKLQKRGKAQTLTDEQFLAALKTIGHPATSREISDKLGISDPEVGRALVRNRMQKLVEEKKVKITKEKREYRFNLP